MLAWKSFRGAKSVSDNTVKHYSDRYNAQLNQQLTEDEKKWKATATAPSGLLFSGRAISKEAIETMFGARRRSSVEQPSHGGDAVVNGGASPSAGAAQDAGTEPSSSDGDSDDHADGEKAELEARRHWRSRLKGVLQWEEKKTDRARQRAVKAKEDEQVEGKQNGKGKRKASTAY
ncbi:hypothetical protein HXX76_003421 [Chlamydomonas incerta]|uniref:Uncharacterized protein n=1 Tax=Chlamydomonas incerta TaxID=51695 RepID=A0A835TD05_CHLIN|nr:hypothetical protein HXX76_003421 [Chlamydomonas incerta]|eukprot:KAG2441811.1 hypothetical protein HXX76_003421 [Chlamydomonas incerta]